MNKVSKAAVLGLCLFGGVFAGSTFAAAGVDVDIAIAPPAPRVEVLPGPRAGYAWAPGYWAYAPGPRGHHWVAGRWLRERRGYRWVPDRWDQVGPRWHRYPGHWER